MNFVGCFGRLHCSSLRAKLLALGRVHLLRVFFHRPEALHLEPDAECSETHGSGLADCWLLGVAVATGDEKAAVLSVEHLKRRWKLVCDKMKKEANKRKKEVHVTSAFNKNSVFFVINEEVGGYVAFVERPPALFVLKMKGYIKNFNLKVYFIRIYYSCKNFEIHNFNITNKIVYFFLLRMPGFGLGCPRAV